MSYQNFPLTFIMQNKRENWMEFFGQPQETLLKWHFLTQKTPLSPPNVFPGMFPPFFIKNEIIAEHTTLLSENAKMSFPHRTGAEPRLQKLFLLFHCRQSFLGNLLSIPRWRRNENKTKIPSNVVFVYTWQLARNFQVPWLFKVFPCRRNNFFLTTKHFHLFGLQEEERRKQKPT